MALPPNWKELILQEVPLIHWLICVTFQWAITALAGGGIGFVGFLIIALGIGGLRYKRFRDEQKARDQEWETMQQGGGGQTQDPTQYQGYQTAGYQPSGANQQQAQGLGGQEYMGGNF